MATPTTWKRRVAQWKASGLTAAEFAADRGYAPATLKWWSSRLNTGSLREEAPAPSDRPALTLPLARLVVRREGSSSSGESAPETPITLEVGAVRLAVRRGFDAEVLRQLRAVLGVGSEGRP